MVAMSINAAPAADYYGRKPKPLEGISRAGTKILAFY